MSLITYLSVFVLTHPDEDHILGFEELLDRVDIGEIWHTPRVFREYHKDLCDDAKAFKKEVERRRDVTIEKGEEPDSGDRVRIIGHDDILDEPEYEGFPDSCRTVPGKEINRLDGADYPEEFEAFIHAPFKDDGDGERNDTSLAMQVELRNGEQTGKALLFGDISYPIARKIFDKTKEKDRLERLEWDDYLAPHHCSKSLMYWKDENGDEVLKQDILDDLEEAAREGAYVIASSESDFSDKKGKNPPHAKARARYEEIVESGHFFCTQEHPNIDNPEPIKFELTEDGLQYVEPSDSENEEETEGSANLAAVVSIARGGESPPDKAVGFGSIV